MRRPVLILALAIPLLVPGPVTAAAVPVLVIEGKGHGHGVGMAQDGALSMGKGGATTAQILNQFYPETTVGRAGGEVRVSVLTAPGNVAVVRFPSGGEVRDAREGGQSAGFPVRVAPGGQARLRFDGRQFVVEVSGGAVPAPASGTAEAAAAPAEPPTTVATTTTTAPRGLLPSPGQPLIPLPPGPLLTAPTLPVLTTTTAPAPTAPPAAAPTRFTTGRPLWAIPGGGGIVEVAERAARYRGVVQAVGGSPLRLINHVDVEQYLRGMGEVRNPSWPAASLRAQAIAARTYAMRAMAGGGELCDTQQCQVYLGAQVEYAAMDKAVAASRGQVLMFRRALASTVYSANGGGFSASTEEGFGTPGAGYPYLRPAPYPTGDPLTWSVTVSLRDVATRVGFRGRVANVRTTAGPSGRVVQVTVEGTGGARSVSGIDFDRALGLKSTLFTVRMGEAAAPPAPPPADAGPVQGLPGGGDPAAGATESAAAAATAGAASAAVSSVAAAPPPAPGPTAASKAALGALGALLLVLVTGATTAARIAGRRPALAGTPPDPPPPAPD